MTFDEFIGKWNDRGIDFDGAYGDQCMDLMHQYCVEVLGLSDGRILAAPAAKDVWLTNPYGKDRFYELANTPTGVPQKGDILLWGTGIGPYGHVAIFLDGDANKFRSFDQNFPTGSKCHLQAHDYTGVLGWLRYKGTVGVETMAVPVKERDWLISRASTAKEVAEYLEINNPDQAPTAEYKNVIGGYKSRITDLAKQVVIATAEVKNREEQVGRLKEQVTESEQLRVDLNIKLNDTLKKANETAGVYESQISTKQLAIDALAKQKGTLNTQIATLQAELLAIKEKTLASLSLWDLLSTTARRILGLPPTSVNKLKKM